ncbi:MAG: helix-turn-helix domain-containing protein [Pseudomonadales bacterium]
MHKKAIYSLTVDLTLRELHDERHIEREKLAQALEISNLTVTRIENGAERKNAGELILMLDVFDLGWEDFMTRVKANLAKAEAQLI